MVGEEVESQPPDCNFPNVRSTYWRSATWNSRSAPPSPCSLPSRPRGGETSADSCSDPFPLLPLQNASCSPETNEHTRPKVFLPPLNCFSLTARTGLDEWPNQGTDHSAGEWTAPFTPGRRRPKNGLDIKLDLASIQRNAIEPTEIQLKREKLAHFDKQCSRVANYHIYLGSDGVARDREILRMNRITHVLNCVGFVCPEYFKDELVYKTLWLQDSPCEDITSLLYDVFDYFEDVREQDGRVFVHCCQGVSRSTTFAIAYLMWRERSSFEDAFQDVKAARGVTNPNMGFACQLLQWQKRVHATPMSSSSVPRIYKLVPHSSYDPLHLVPKALNHLASNFLDSRGAFVIQSSQLIIVWIGHYSDCKMTQAAVAAADQILRYERTHVPVKIIGEGHEDAEFWKILKDLDDERPKNGCLKEGFGDGVPNYQEENNTERITQVGSRKVSSYDIEYAIYQIARVGGVIPPISFSSSPTLLPLGDDGWTAVRCKFLSGEIVGAAKVASLNGIPVAAILSPDTSMESSSPHLSPFSATSACSTHSSCDSPDESLAFSPANLARCSDCLTSNSACSGHGGLYSSFSGFPQTMPLNSFPESINKRSASSLAYRRGSVPPLLHLPGLDNEPPPAPRGMSRKLKLPPIVTEEQERTQKHSNHRIGAVCEMSVSQQNLGNDPCQIGSDVASSSASGSQYIHDDPQKLGCVSLYAWPGFEQIEMYDLDDLDTGAVLILDASKCQFKVYVWVGRLQQYQNEDPDNDLEETWHKIGQDFLHSLGLPSDVMIAVVSEGSEPEEFWEAFN